jgi:hypothetical protein
VERHILSSQPDVAPPHFSFLNELARHKLSRVDGNGKTEALGWKDDRCIDANDISPGTNERASRIPGFRAASVWMTLSINRPVIDRRNRRGTHSG